MYNCTLVPTGKAVALDSFKTSLLSNLKKRALVADVITVIYFFSQDIFAVCILDVSSKQLPSSSFFHYYSFFKRGKVVAIYVFGFIANEFPGKV